MQRALPKHRPNVGESSLPSAPVPSTSSAVLFLIAAAFTCDARQNGALRAGVQPEDPAIRAQAVALLEEAIQTSSPPSWTNVQIDTRFHVFNPKPGDPTDGEHILTVGSPWKLRRHEWIYGPNHLVLVRNGDNAYWMVSQGQKPPFADTIENTTPIDLVRFNREDIVHSIADGPNGAACINFSTEFGDREQTGQICIDRQQHFLLSKKIGDTLTINSNFIPFNHAFVPAHVEISVAGVPQFIFEQTITPQTEFPPDFFAVPENALVHFGNAGCSDRDPPHPLNAPQPTPLGPSPAFTDIRLHGFVDVDGHLYNLQPVDNIYPDLNAQALRIASGWTYTPGMCDGKRVNWYMEFIVEFKGR